MRIKQLLDNRFATVVAGAAVVALIGAGAGYSAGTITSKDIKDKTIKIKDIRPGTVKKLKGQTGPQGPAGPSGTGVTKVTTLASGPFSIFNNNPSVSLTPDGVEYGPYADGGADGGTVCYSGLNGQPFSAVKSLAFVARYAATNNTGGVGVPYLRVFLGNNAHDAIFSPNTQQPDPDIDEGEFNEWVATQGSWRYDDDGGNNPDSPFATIQSAHATEVIGGRGVCISVGVTSGVNLQALLRSWEINGTNYVFRGN